MRINNTDNERHWTDWFFMMSLLLVPLAIGILWFAISSNDKKCEIERHKVYSTWVKVTNRSDITYDEWNRLEYHRLLPVIYIGQSNIKSEIESK